MFIGLVVVIMIISISVLAIVNWYFLAFSNNFGDLNDYYSSKYAAVSAIERWISERNDSSSPVTGSGLDDWIWTWEWHYVPNTNEIIATGEMRDYTNTLQYTIPNNG